MKHVNTPSLSSLNAKQGEADTLKLTLNNDRKAAVNKWGFCIKENRMCSELDFYEIFNNVVLKYFHTSEMLKHLLQFLCIQSSVFSTL